MLAAFAGGAVIYESLKQDLESDYLTHMIFTAQLLHGQAPPGDFLFYLFNALFARFKPVLGPLQLSLALVLGIAIGAKVWLSVRFVTAELHAVLPRAPPGWLPAWAAVATMLCAFTFSLPVRTRAYIGQIPPNVWHNSTTILLMPFAIGLFWTTLSFLRTGSKRWVWWSLPLVALSLAAKPSFMLCLLPAFGLLALLRFRLTRPLLWAVLLGGVAVALLGLQSAYVYVVDPRTADSSGGIAIHPLAVWRFFSGNIPLSILASTVFPLAALTLGGAAVRASLAVRYAGLLLLAAVAEYALLAERGVREFEGNLTWQSIVAMYILFVALVSALVPWYQQRKVGWRHAVIAVAFLIQVAAGPIYLHHWFATANPL